MKVKIGELAKIKTGKLDANAASEDGQYPFFTCSKEPLRISTYSYDCECVLVAGNGDLNVKYYNGKFDAYQRTYIIEDNGSGKLYMPYLYYFMESYIEELRKQAIGGVIKYIKLGNLTDALIELPSVDEQQSIVEILEKAKGILEKRNDELNTLDDLIKARFVEMFGDPVVNEKRWMTKPLLDMGQCKNGMNFHYDDKGIEINCLGVGDFKNLSVIDNTEELPTVSLNEMPSEEYLLKDDDIVFVRSNGNKALVGRSLAVYPGDVPTTFSGFCIRYRKYDNEIIVPYLLRVLKTDSMRVKMTGRGANIQNLNQQILGTLVIPVPPIELQEQFANFVKQVDKSKVTKQIDSPIS
jgi:type I restriction enzyme S subunit